MDVEFKYRGQSYSGQEIAFVRQLIAENPDDSRRALSKKLCLAWKWVQKNGALRDMVCRSFMLEPERAGHIVLPARKMKPRNNLAERKKPVKMEVDRLPVCGKLSDIMPIEFCQVRRREQEPLCNSLIEQFHCLPVIAKDFCSYSRRGKDCILVYSSLSATRNTDQKTNEKRCIGIFHFPNSLLFDFATWDNVVVPANGTWSRSATNYLYATNPPGTYKVMIRGLVGANDWFDFDVTGNGTNPASHERKSNSMSSMWTGPIPI